MPAETFTLRTEFDILRDELAGVKVSVPESRLKRLVSQGQLWRLFEWAADVGLACLNHTPVPTPPPVLIPFLTPAQRGLDWREFCEQIITPPPSAKQGTLFDF